MQSIRTGFVVWVVRKGKGFVALFHPTQVGKDLDDDDPMTFGRWW